MPTPIAAPALTLLALCLAVLPAPTRADEVLVAVAANFTGPLDRIAAGFTAATGHVIKAVPGSTGKFFSQIVTGGAPYEALLAADDETPKRLIASGHAVAGSNFTYAIGKLVLWSAQPGLVDEQGAILAAPGKFGKLAIASPKVAPYGVAALEVLKARGLTEAVTPKLVTGESIAQAWQFVVTGNAEIGFIALSQVAVPGKPFTGSMWRVPQSLYTEIRQDAVLLESGRSKAAPRALLDWLKTPAAKAVITAYGYGP